MIDRVLDNSASSVESKATMDWFATEEGQEYLSQRITAESVLMGEREIEEWTGGNSHRANEEAFLGTNKAA